MDLARVDLVEQRHHDERVEDDGEVLIGSSAERLSAVVDVEQLLSCTTTTVPSRLQQSTTGAPGSGRYFRVSAVVQYRTRDREVTGSTHTRSTASNLDQVANLLFAQANSASYPQRDGK